MNSLKTRPLDQSASTRKLRNGSFTATLVVTKITAESPASFFLTANFKSDRCRGQDKPARLKESREASVTSKSSISPARAEITSISASNGWFKKELTSISPRPNAKLFVDKVMLAKQKVKISPRLRTFRLPNSLLSFLLKVQRIHTPIIQLENLL